MLKASQEINILDFSSIALDRVLKYTLAWLWLRGEHLSIQHIAIFLFWYT